MAVGKYRNHKCYCNSGKKYKQCHLYLDQGWGYHPGRKTWLPRVLIVGIVKGGE